MPIEREERLYEILIRFDETGELFGAHEIRNMMLIDTEAGEILSVKAGAPKDIDIDSLTGILNKTFRSEYSAMEKYIKSLTTDIENAKSHIEELKENVKSLTNDIENAKSYIEELENAKSAISDMVTPEVLETPEASEASDMVTPEILENEEAAS